MRSRSFVLNSLCRYVVWSREFYLKILNMFIMFSDHSNGIRSYKPKLTRYLTFFSARWLGFKLMWLLLEMLTLFVGVEKLSLKMLVNIMISIIKTCFHSKTVHIALFWLRIELWTLYFITLVKLSLNNLRFNRLVSCVSQL